MTFKNDLAAALRDVGITPPPHDVNTGEGLATALIARLSYDVDALIAENAEARRQARDVYAITQRHKGCSDDCDAAKIADAMKIKPPAPREDALTDDALVDLFIDAIAYGVGRGAANGTSRFADSDVIEYAREKATEARRV